MSLQKRFKKKKKYMNANELTTEKMDPKQTKGCSVRPNL